MIVQQSTMIVVKSGRENMMNRNFVPEKEYSRKVDELRYNRVQTSFFKYGSARENYGRGLVDAIASHEQCVNEYNRTGNKEYLLDAMNYLMFEFMYPQKEGAYFRPTDSKESAGIVGISVAEMERIKENEY